MGVCVKGVWVVGAASVADLAVSNRGDGLTAGLVVVVVLVLVLVVAGVMVVLCELVVVGLPLVVC